jgi:predicted HNH restriction endonuclease
MGLWYVESWTISKGDIEKHEEIFKKWVQHQSSLIEKEGMYFRRRFGPGGGRVVMTKFESFTDFDEAFEILNNDEKNIELRDEWASKINTESWKGEFWIDLEI